MRLPSSKIIGLAAFGVLAAVATALGCPFFRNPSAYASSGAIVGSLRTIVDAHRKR